MEMCEHAITVLFICSCSSIVSIVKVIMCGNFMTVLYVYYIQVSYSIKINFRTVYTGCNIKALIVDEPFNLLNTFELF